MCFFNSTTWTRWIFERTFFAVAVMAWLLDASALLLASKILFQMSLHSWNAMPLAMRRLNEREWTTRKKRAFYKNYIARFKLLTSMFKTIKSYRNGKVCSASSWFQGHFKNKIEVNNKRKKKIKPQQQQKCQTRLLTHSHMILGESNTCASAAPWANDRAPRKHLLRRINACVPFNVILKCDYYHE